MHKQCSTFKNVLNLRYSFFVMYLIFQKIKIMIIFKHLFAISIPSKALATSSQYVRKLANFALIYCWLWEYHVHDIFIDNFANERLVYGWRKIMENITCGYGHHEWNNGFITSGRRPRVMNPLFSRVMTITTSDIFHYFLPAIY